MNKYVLAALLCPLLGARAVAGATDASGVMVGAYEPTTPDAPLVLEAKTFVQKHLASMSLGEVLEAYTQVVAGLNIKLVCPVTGDDGSAIWQFVAYRSLDRQWHLTSARRLSPSKD